MIGTLAQAIMGKWHKTKNATAKNRCEDVCADYNWHCATCFYIIGTRFHPCKIRMKRTFVPMCQSFSQLLDKKGKKRKVYI